MSCMRDSITVPLLVLLFLSLPQPERTQNWNSDAGGSGGDETPYNTGNRVDPGITPVPTRRSGWDWMPRDTFDEFIAEFDSVTAENCHLHRDARMSPDTLQAVTVFNDLIPSYDFPNRTRMLQMHNEAMRLSFFYSLIFQTLNRSREEFAMQPGMLYYYLGMAASVTANQDVINGSAIYFDTSCCYANWYRTLVFNKTLSLFGPRAYQFDDSAEPYNWLREPTNNTVQIVDMGVGPNGDYMSPSYLNNPYINDEPTLINFIPDMSTRSHSNGKFTYTVKLKRAYRTGLWLYDRLETAEFFGTTPQSQKEDEFFPVLFTPPYFDCGHMNRWIYSAVSPIIDFMPRYSPYNHVRKPQFVAVAVLDTELTRLDINPCPRAPGNIPPNRFEGVARCKETTICEPIWRWGVQRRGGYKCMCKPGYRYPYWQQGPFLGIDIEQATEDEYRDGFDCIKVQWRQHWPYRLELENNTATGSEPPPEASPCINSSNSPASASHTEYKQKRGRRRASSQKLQNHDIKLAHAKPELISKQQLSSRLPNDSNQYSFIVDQPASNVNESPTFYSLEDRLDILFGHKKKSYPSDTQISNALVGGESQRNVRRHTRETGPRKWNLSKKNDSDSVNVLGRGARSSGERRKRYRREIGYLSRYPVFDESQYDRVEAMMAHKDFVTEKNCEVLSDEELDLPFDVNYGADYFFENHAHSALRLSHFLSAFLQISDADEMYGFYLGDKRLNQHQLYAEVISEVMADMTLLAVGIFFEKDKLVLPNGTVVEYFGPFAFEDLVLSNVPNWNDSSQQTDQSSTNALTPIKFFAVDYAGFRDGYVNEKWFREVKQRWASNVYGLKRFLVKPFVRADLQGSQQKRFEHFPMYFYAPTIDDGTWSAPYFECRFLYVAKHKN